MNVIYFSHAARIFVDPSFLAALVLGCSLLLKRFRKFSFVLAVSAFLVLILLGSAIISDRLVASLEDQYPDSGVPGIPPAQAIVVLGGSLRLQAGQHPASHLTESSDRLLVALRLYRAGKAPLILCSGGNLSTFAPAVPPSEAFEMSSLFQEWGLPASAILTEERSGNTYENATMSFDLLASRHIRRIILVTSAIHMPRAAATFRKAGFEVVPAPADYGWGGADTGWLPNAGTMGNTQMALHEWIGLWIYRLRGWA